MKNFKVFHSKVLPYIDVYFLKFCCLHLQQMKRLAREVSPDIKQIDLDVHRTFRDHVMFRERYNIK